MNPATGECGYTLVELLVVCIIIGSIISIALPLFTKSVVSAKNNRAIADLTSIERAIIAYAIERDAYPATLADAGVTVKDPWGNDYQYVVFPSATAHRKDMGINDLNEFFDLYSKGNDGITSTNIVDAPDDIIRASDGAFKGVASSYL